MFHSIYARMLATYIMISIFILLLQSVLLVQLLKNTYLDNAIEAATDQAEQMSKIISAQQDISATSVSELVALMTEYSSPSSSIWLVNEDGVVIDVSSNNDLYYNSSAIADGIDQVFGGDTVSFEDKFNRSIYQSTLSIATPVWIDNQISYALFLHTATDVDMGINNTVYQHILISGIVAVAICAVLVSISSRHISYPIKQLSKMCVGISNGNYNTKIHTDGDDEISHLAASFNDMSAQLKRHEELRVNFVANVSHELRSPITSIHGFAQGMRDGTVEQSDYQKYSGIILDETTRLKKLISELLDLSQIDSGEFPLHFKEFDINEQIRRAIIKYIDRMEENGIELEVDFVEEYCNVFADADRIDQILVNLIDNAIKFTPEHGTISIWTKKENEKILVGIRDTGCGIPEEDLVNVFERFYKSEKAHSEKVGTGLGLSIVKKMLAQHGEKITVTSEIDKGTEFVFTLTSVVID